MTNLIELEETINLVQADIALTTKQTAIYLNLSPRTLESYRLTGEGPRFYRYGRIVRYSVSDLKIWKQKRLFNSTSERVKND